MTLDKLSVWFRNAQTFHHRVAARFLRNRGWVVFYLEERSRICGDGTCWLKLYQQEEKKGK